MTVTVTPEDLADLSQRYGGLFKLIEQCAAAHRELAGLEANLLLFQRPKTTCRPHRY